MNRQKRQRAEPASNRGEDQGKRVGPVDHHEPPARRQDRERGLNPIG